MEVSLRWWCTLPIPVCSPYILAATMWISLQRMPSHCDPCHAFLPQHTMLSETGSQREPLFLKMVKGACHRDEKISWQTAWLLFFFRYRWTAVMEALLIQPDCLWESQLSQFLLIWPFSHTFEKGGLFKFLLCLLCGRHCSWFPANWKWSTGGKLCSVHLSFWSEKHNATVECHWCDSDEFYKEIRREEKGIFGIEYLKVTIN